MDGKQDLQVKMTFCLWAGGGGGGGGRQLERPSDRNEKWSVADGERRSEKAKDLVIC